MRKRGKSLEGHTHQFEFFCKKRHIPSIRGDTGQLGELICAVCKGVQSEMSHMPPFTCLSSLVGHIDVSSAVADDRKLLPWCLELLRHTPRACRWNPWKTEQEKIYQPRSCCFGVRSYYEREERNGFCNDRGF